MSKFIPNQSLYLNDLNSIKSQNELYTPLHEAAKQGQVNIISSLCDKDRSAVELKDINGMTPLHYAALFNHKEAYKFLITMGSDTFCEDNFGRTPQYIMYNHQFLDLTGDQEFSCCSIIM